MKKQKTDIIIIAICCVLVAACVAFLVWKLVPWDNLGEDSSPTTSAPTNEEKPEFKPSVSFDEDFVFDFMGEDLTKYLILGEYKGIKLTAKVAEMTDEELQQALQAYMVAEKYATTENVTDAEIKLNDKINVDLSLYVDGKLNSTYSQKNVTITVTDKKDDTISKSLVDQRPGATVYVDVTEDLKDEKEFKDAEKVEYAVKINHIIVTTYPELNDEFAKENLGYDTFAEFIQYFNKYANADNAFTNDEDLYGTFLEKMLDNCEIISVPEEYFTNMLNYQISYYEYYAYMYGIDYKTFLKDYVKTTEEELKEMISDQIMSNILVYSIIKAENITAPEDMIEEYTKLYAEQAGMTPEKFIEEYGEEYVKEIVLMEKFSEMIIVTADIEFAPETTGTATAGATATK